MTQSVFPVQGGLSGNLVAGLIGNNVIDPFAVSDNNNITGQLLRDLIGAAFGEHQTLQTMNAVVASSTAMNAVAASATAMNAVVASLTARSAVRQSTIAINAISAAQSALDIMYTAAVKFTHTGLAWSANPATLVGTGNYLIVRFTQVTAFWPTGTIEGQYLRRGDLSTWIMTDGDNTADIPTRASGTRRDNALRAVNNTSIQYLLAETFEIAYLTA